MEEIDSLFTKKLFTMDTSVKTNVGVSPSVHEVGNEFEVNTSNFKITMTEENSSLAAILGMVNSLPIPKVE